MYKEYCDNVPKSLVGSSEEREREKIEKRKENNEINIRNLVRQARCNRKNFEATVKNKEKIKTKPMEITFRMRQIEV